MLTGYNTDVPFEGTTYHVQTEDRGAANPVIDTLVYCGGQILHQEKHSYAQLESAGYPEAEVARRLDAQHRDLVRRARHGEFALVLEKTAALPDDDLETALDQFLAEDRELVWLKLRWMPADESPLSGTLEVLDQEGRPAAEAAVQVRLIASERAPLVLEPLTCDAQGRAKISLPAEAERYSAMVFSAELGPGGGKLRCAPVSAGAPALAGSHAPPSSV